MTETSATRRGKVLLLTNCELGEANVFLATIHAILQLNPQTEIHCASFGSLKEAVASISDELCNVPQTTPVVFHELKGLPMKEGMNQCLSRDGAPPREPDYLPKSILEQPGFSNTTRAMRDMIPLFVPYTGPQFVAVYDSIVEVITTVAADLVVVDSLMTAALTACYHLKTKFVCLSPNSIKEFAGLAQPYGAALWKFPADGHRKEVERYLKSQTGATLRTPLDLLRGRPAELKILVGSLPELDFPLIIPEGILPCGPVLRSVSPVAESDPDLANWLNKGPTIYVNLGTLCTITEDRAAELAVAMKTVLEALDSQSQPSRYQVLWKIQKLGEYDLSGSNSKIAGTLGKWNHNDSVKIVEWFQVQPNSVLHSGNVACSIHHGGANSYNEAASAGIPQVVLPQWADCYDYAERVELLGVGRMGNKQAKPQWSAPELSEAVLDVLVGETSTTAKQKATALADVCEKNGDGAVKAARIVLDECAKNIV